MGRTVSKETREASLARLELEAGRVAEAMSSLRGECLKRLRGAFGVPPLREDSAHSRRSSRGAANTGFSPFYYYPFLFAGAFPSVRMDDFRTLALANRILLEAILIADRKIDEDQPWSPTDFYLHDIYFHKALELLLPLFPLDHAFWQKTQEWFLQHARAIIKEQSRHRHRLCRYTRDEFYEIATGKVALIKTTVLAMDLLSGAPGPLETRTAILESQDRFLAGFQCFDDLRDWKQDLRHRNFSFLLTRALTEGRLSHLLRGNGPLPQEDVGRVLYYRGIAEEQLGLAEEYFQGAIDLVGEIDVSDWTNMIREFLRHCHTLRRDLAEIRRRSTRKGTPKGIEACLSGALDFIVRSAGPCGGFSLARSSYPYMTPSSPLASSRFVTFCLCAALGPLQGMDARLPPLLGKASRWLNRAQRSVVDTSLPAPLEESFAGIATGEPEPAIFDEEPDNPRALPPHGLFWAYLLFTAARKGLRLPKLESRVRDSIRQADYRPWTHGGPGGSSLHPPSRGVCHPLVPLVLFCGAMGSRLPRMPIHEYVLRRCRTAGAENNPTETVLRLLCLLSTGYRGPEASLAADQLRRTQEPDGSWSPNPLYEMEQLFYGSRALTTAWCLLALFVYHLGPRLPAGGEKDPRPPDRQTPSPAIVLHEGLPKRLDGSARSMVNKLLAILLPPWPHTLYIGHWPAMPPHFLLHTGQGIVAGVNTDPRHAEPALSTGRRPLNVEIAMAMMSAHRCLRMGALRDRLERAYVGGAALHACAEIWPRQPPWDRLGMTKMDWDWCREHEPFLWEELRRFLLHPAPGQLPFRWLLPDAPAASGSPIPRGACLFLGKSLFSGPADGRRKGLRINDLLGNSRADILRMFRRKAGLDSNEHSVT